MPATDATRKMTYELTVADITPEVLDTLYPGCRPEVDLAQELWPKLSARARRWALGYITVGDFGLASEELLMYAMEENVVVPQWVIDAGATINEHWGWSPNVEKACAALQARLDEHNRGGGG